MAKSIIRLILLLGAFICLGASGHSAGISKREKLIEVYTSQIGVRETSPNAGSMVEAFLASVNLPKGYAWCGAFVTWCSIQAETDIPKGPAWAPSWFCSSHVIKHEDAQAGDVFGIWFPKKKRIAHVGFIDEAWDKANNVILTVEGNTNEAGSRDGDGVYRKRRSKHQIYKVSRWVN